MTIKADYLKTSNSFEGEELQDLEDVMAQYFNSLLMKDIVSS